MLQVVVLAEVVLEDGARKVCVEEVDSLAVGQIPQLVDRLGLFAQRVERGDVEVAEALREKRLPPRLCHR